MTFEAFWVPQKLFNAEALAIGERWLLDSSYPGEKLIVLHAKKMTQNDRTLADMATRYRVASPRSIGSARRRGSNAVLAPWASDEALRLAEELANPDGGLLVIEGTLNELSTWIRGTRATNLADPGVGPAAPLALDAAVTKILDSLLIFDGHNRFYGAYGKEEAVRKLRAMVAAGHRPTPEELQEYAIRSGETDHEGAGHLRELYEGVLTGKRFRSRDGRTI